MKKLFYLLLAMMLIGVSCEDSSKDVDSTPKGVVFASGTEMTVEFGSSGGSKSFSFSSDLDWEVTTSADWISVTPSSGTPSVKKFTVKASANDSFEERSGTVTMTTTDDRSYIIEVTQAAENETFTINGNGEYEVSATGGEVEVKVTTNLEYTVEIPAEAKAWLSVADTRAVREETLTFTVAENASFDERSATVELKGADGKVLQSISFKQKGEERVFDTDGEGNYVVEAVGGEVEVKVTTNLEYTVEIPAEAKAWLSVADTRAVREETLTFTVAKNETFDERSATVELKGADGKVLQSIVFKQKGEEKVFDTDGEGNYVVEAVGGEVAVKVTTNLEYTVEIPAEAKAWLSVADTRAVREETLTFTVAKNETLDERSATVELKGADGEVLQSISFKQKEYGGAIEVDEEYVVDAEGGELEVKLSTDIDFTTSIPEEAKSWISIVETRSMRSESLTFNIAINDDVKERSATINLQNAKGNDVASFVIRQKGGDALLELQNQYSISNMGGNFEVAVTTNLEYEVEISADATSWLSYVETRARRTDKLIFNATPNEGDAERSGTIKLIGENSEELQVITVTQRGNIFEFAYTTNDGKPLDPHTTEGFGGEFKDNVYDAATGHGVLKFAGAVTTIPKHAFAICENLTWIDIPEGITTIGASAFISCSSMVELTIPDSVTTIGDYAFSDCSSLTSVVIGDSVTTIGDYAFSDCSRLTSVYITDIAAWCNISFGDSTSNPLDYARALYLNNELVTDLTIPDGVTTIGDYVFWDCDSLRSVTIPDSVTTIGNRAFGGCSSLTSVVIGDSVTTIGDYAFSDCSSLTRVTIGDSVTSIGENAFYDCRSLTSVYCKPTTPPTLGGTPPIFYSNIDALRIYVPEGSRRTYQNAKNWSEYYYRMAECDFNYTMAISYTTSDGMPANANGLIISNSYQNGVGELKYFGKDIIPEDLFRNCDNLTSVTIPDSVTTIGDNAFWDCSSLTSVTIPSSVTTIGNHAFGACSSLTSVTIPDSVTTIGSCAFQGCESLTSITIPDSVTTIGTMAFSACYSLTSVTIGNSVTAIGYMVFYDCNSLTSVTIPDSVTMIGEDAFFSCESLTSVTIPDSVTTIGDSAFCGCSSLTSVTIPDSVTTIENYAFMDCESLTSVYCKATTPPNATTINFRDWIAFDNNASGRKIYVPVESVKAYKGANHWCDYADDIVGYVFE